MCSSTPTWRHILPFFNPAYYNTAASQYNLYKYIQYESVHKTILMQAEYNVLHRRGAAAGMNEIVPFSIFIVLSVDFKQHTINTIQCHTKHIKQAETRQV